jgi:cysteine-rich repeat protein
MAKEASMQMNIVRRWAGHALLGGAMILALGGMASAQSASAKCEAGKEKCVTGLATALLSCFGKDNAKPDPIKFQACIDKALTKYSGGADPAKGCFAKLEAKPPCLTTGDSDAIGGQTQAVAGAVRFALDPAAPPSTLSKCASGKFKCATNLVKAILGCDGKNTAKPDPVKFTECITKAQTKYTGGVDPTKGCFAKLEAKVPNDCITTGDSAPVETQTETALRNLVPLLTCGNSVVGFGENCDDGNRTGGDGCSAFCRTEVCGNSIVDVGESCDDGNTIDGDDCPGDCVIDACSPISGSVRGATVNWNAPVSVGSLTVLVDYPEGKVSIPGSGGSVPAGILFGFPSGTSPQANDLEYALREVVVKATAITPRPGQLFKINFEDCSGATPPVAGDFTCTVVTAFAPDGITPVSGATCSVTVP